MNFTTTLKPLNFADSPKSAISDYYNLMKSKIHIIIKYDGFGLFIKETKLKAFSGTARQAKLL